MARLNTIGRKLFITYFMILIIAFVVTGLTFRILIQSYFVKETKSQLRTQGQAVAETLKKMTINDGKNLGNLVLKRDLRIAGRFMDANMVILNPQGKIVYTNGEDIDKKVLGRIIRNGNTRLKDYVTERIPIYSPKDEIKGYVFLFTKITELKELNRLMGGAQILSFFIAGLIAIIIGFLFQKKLTDPIKKLMDSMSNFSLKNFPDDFHIKTGDEIEALSLCFNGLGKKLKEYDRRQKALLQNTSHELKTPLMSIQGYAEAIKDGIVEGEEMEESLDIIIEESQRLKKTVEEIIYLTKLENVEEVFDLKNNSLEEIIQRAVKAVKPLAEDRNIAIQMEGDFKFEGLYDEEKLKRGFINLLDNGIRYGKNRIVIEAIPRGKNMEVLIIDDGEGFSDGEEVKIFNRFYKGKGGNTGLGLAITKAVIEGNHGEIFAFNHPSKGAVFKIMLPIILKRQ